MPNKNELFYIQTKLISQDAHFTELRFCIDGQNILEYRYKNEPFTRTSTGNFDDLFEYLEQTLSLVESDVSFPYEVEGNSATEMDANARHFDSEDFDEFDAYYDKLDAWSRPHSWIHARDIYYVADVMFRKVDNDIEMSWDNENLYDDVRYTSLRGCVRIPCDQYKTVILTAIEDYRKLWG